MLGCSQTFQNEGGGKGGGGRLNWTQNGSSELSIDPCTKCHFIWGSRGGGLGFTLRRLNALAPPPLAMPLIK